MRFITTTPDQMIKLHTISNSTNSLLIPSARTTYYGLKLTLDLRSGILYPGELERLTPAVALKKLLRFICCQLMMGNARQCAPLFLFG